jgi:hypothetical protein
VIRDLVIVLWFAIAALAFFGPWLGWPVPVRELGAIYALVLVGGIAFALYERSRKA